MHKQTQVSDLDHTTLKRTNFILQVYMKLCYPTSESLRGASLAAMCGGRGDTSVTNTATLQEHRSHVPSLITTADAA